MWFQELILTLHRFYSERGCVISEPFDLQVGAGTFYPMTFLKALGPEPWNTAYVAPSRRPQDGRYGENPYRFQYYFQYQVILKPSPADVQEVYLDSLRAIGIHPEEHDVRFVEDNWESPTLGAWGLGWEVWLDGMEITQFTYFQQVGGINLKPISVELTYGLERIAMYLQKAPHAYEIEYAPGVTIGDLRRDFELQHCQYNFEFANPEKLRRWFDDYEEEARRLIGLGLVHPGYEFVLQASHAFNVLDARGVLAHAERQAYIQRVRRIAEATARTYLEQISGEVHGTAL